MSKRKKQKFGWDLSTDVTISQCFWCKWKHKGKHGATCDAFPDGIPEDILNNEFEHIVPYPTQKNSIVFEKEE